MATVDKISLFSGLGSSTILTLQSYSVAVTLKWCPELDGRTMRTSITTTAATAAPVFQSIFIDAQRTAVGSTGHGLHELFSITDRIRFNARPHPRTARRDGEASISTGQSPLPNTDQDPSILVDQSLSMIVTFACPPPSHIVCSP